jgi:cytochrome c
VTLTVTDDKGGRGIASTKVFTGNTPPVVKIESSSNRSFYWDNSFLDYKVLVSDKEETAVNPEKIKVNFGYLPRGKDLAVILTQNQNVTDFNFLKGQQLTANLDCKSCHSVDRASVGPTYLAISERYSGKKGALNYLSTKIIQGGSGVWGERAMTPHPELSTADSEEIVNYILSLTEKSSRKRPLEDNITLKDHVGKGIDGLYLLNASYTDQGANGIEPLQSRDYIILRNPFVQAEDFDEGNVRLGTITTDVLTYATSINHNSFIRFNSVDLMNVKQLRFRVRAHNGGLIEVHHGNRNSPVISSITVPARIAGAQAKWIEIVSEMKQTDGIQDLFFVFVDENGKKNLFDLDWIYFGNSKL